MKRSILFVFACAALTAIPASAATYYVGTCHAGSFATISAAVSSASVAPGSTIDICPGNYQEQVIIHKSLTLQGILFNAEDAANLFGSVSDRTVTNLNQDVLRPSIWVTAGTVNLSNISISQTYGPTDCSSNITGVYYASGSSGTMNHINVSILPSQPANCFNSIGVWAENNHSLKHTVTIQNSTFAVAQTGVSILSQQAGGVPPVLSATVGANQIYLFGSNSVGVFMQNNAGSVTNNLISGASVGLVLASTKLSATGNTINAGQGIQVGPQSTITGNRIRASTGLVFGCQAATANTNTITGNGDTASTGYLQPPKGFSGVNTFHNISTISTGTC